MLLAGWPICGHSPIHPPVSVSPMLPSLCCCTVPGQVRKKNNSSLLKPLRQKPRTFGRLLSFTLKRQVPNFKCKRGTRSKDRICPTPTSFWRIGWTELRFNFRGSFSARNWEETGMIAFSGFFGQLEESQCAVGWGLGYGKGWQGPCFPKQRLSCYQKQHLSLSAMTVFSGLLNPNLNQGANFSPWVRHLCAPLGLSVRDFSISWLMAWSKSFLGSNFHFYLFLTDRILLKSNMIQHPPPPCLTIPCFY